MTKSPLSGLPQSPNGAAAAQSPESLGAQANPASATATTGQKDPDAGQPKDPDTSQTSSAPGGTTTPPPEKSKTKELFGLLFSRKIDLVAIAALLLSIGAIVPAVLGFSKGAELTLLPPDQIFLWQVTYPGNPPEALFGTTLIYVNKGEKGYNAIVRREAVHVTIAGNDFELGWDRFTDFKNSKPIEDKSKQAVPFSVDGRASDAHGTAFIAWPRPCTALTQGPCDEMGNHLKWADFISALRGMVQAGRREFSFKFTADVIDAKPLAASCKITIDRATVDVIDGSKSYSPTCFPD